MLKILMTAVFLFCGTVALADDVTAVFKQRVQAIKSMQADFSQVVHNPHGKITQHGNGRVAILKPGLFRWDQKQPTQQIIIGNKGTLWIYDIDLEQVTIQKLSKAMGDTPALLLSDANPAITEHFKVLKASMNDQGADWFQLIPKDSSSLFTALWIGFKNQAIVAMRLKDHIGNVTDVNFSHATTNAGLPISLFQFKLPKNVDVIDETKDRRR